MKMDLKSATHKDINDIVSALKRGVLNQLLELVQISQSNALNMDDSCHSLRKKLTSYEWVCQLSYFQSETQRLLKLKDDEQRDGVSRFLASIGIDQLLVSELSIKDVLALVRLYGIIEIIDEKNPKMITIMAANLSLKDLLKYSLGKRNEIHILCTECLYLDASIEDKIWASKNIAIKAPKVHVIGNCQIDVSGVHGDDGTEDSCKAEDGRESESPGHGDHGNNGEEGTPGQSGGNIVIFADEIVDSEKLFLKSCGGNGGKGQNGGDGQDGKDKESEQDHDWPHNFSHSLVKTSSSAQATIKNKMRSFEHYEHEKESALARYMYGEAKSGVRVLFGSVNSFFCRYGFLLSLSKDGESADGGNAGTGGRAGGGGKAGNISLKALDGSPHVNLRTTECEPGLDGKPGENGTCGKKAIANRKYDFLVVDGAVWGKSKKYVDAFIEVKPSQSGELGRGQYYCKKKVSQQLDREINADYIGFFKARKDLPCLTSEGRQANSGKANKERSILKKATKRKAIDVATLHVNYQLYVNQTPVLQDRSALLQSLNQLEHTLHEKLQELETVHVKWQQKQVHHISSTSGDSYVDLVNIKPMSKGLIVETPIPFKLDQLEGLDRFLLDDITSNLVSVQEKYSRVREIFQNALMEDDMNKETSRFAQATSSDICQMLDAILNPIVCVMRFKHTHEIDGCIELLNSLQDKSHSKYQKQMNKVNQKIKDLLIQQYRWCVLADIYAKHFAAIAYADQSKSVAVYTELLKLTSTEQLKTFVPELISCPPSLPSYGTSCSTILPLCQNAQNALELLMVFINENNNTSVYFPDILWCIHKEYETFHSTITDPDLLFIANYLMDKFKKRMDITQLEDLFCEKLLSKVYDHTLEGYIIYERKTYQIVEQSDQSICHVRIVTLSKDNDITHYFDIFPDRVTLDDKLIAFPNDDLLVCTDDKLLVSPFDINKVWQILEKGGRIEDLEKLVGDDAQDDYKAQLIFLMQQASEAKNVPYNVFTYHPPSQWVEQLILYAIRAHYQDQDPNFVADVQQAISGLSLCCDKTLYYTFFSQFLYGFVFKSDLYSTDILETLQAMKSVFIDRQLCTLVSQHGISQAWPETSAEMIFAYLEDSGLIDDTGIFLPDVTADTIQSYCHMYTQNLSPKYLNIIYSMQRYTRDLPGRELSFWSYKINELCLRLDLQDMVKGDTDDQTNDNMVMLVQQLVRNFGDKKVSKFMSALNSTQKKVPAALLKDLFKKCACKDWVFDTVINQIQEKATQSLEYILIELQRYPWESVYKQQCTAAKIIASLKSQLTKDTHSLSSKLDSITTMVDKIDKKRNECSHFQKSEWPICKYTERNIKDWAVAFRQSTIHGEKNPFDHPLFAEAFAVICRGVTLFYEKNGKIGITPRDNQMVASLLFLQNLSVQRGARQGTRLMQQISTGEGKTVIICMTAIFKALLGEKVDIITSSSVLATRDAVEQNFLYSLFDVSVSHCCHEELTKRRQAYESNVIYGDIGSFQRDILETNFYDHQIRTDHGFDNVVIDEVDSMLVDKGETLLYLPHALPDLNALDRIYLEIWSFVNANDFVGLPEQQDQLHDALKIELLGDLPINAFTVISEITEKEAYDIHRRCIDMGLTNQDHTNDEIRRLIQTVDAIPKDLRQEVMMVIQQHLEDTKPIIQSIPVSLHPFIRKSLKSWIQSAVNAKYYQPNKQYIIDIDHRESAGDRYPKIIIMDNETGVEQESSEWGSGLHQFLQLKHHLRLSTESLKAVYMSNISFFNSYTNIMGVTGTLGSNAEHILFNKLYKNTMLLVLPTNTPSRLHIEPQICKSSIDDWKVAIGENVEEKLKKRAVLLICEDVEQAKQLHDYFIEKNPELYISSHQEKLEVSGDSQRGRFIISTNLAGRGTDLKLSQYVKCNGGLHVCLSYLPPNVRVENQAYGRAARMGDRGSCKLIFRDEQGNANYAIRKRDLSEALRVADIEADYYHNIQFQEELFDKFTAKYDEIKTECKDKSDKRPKLDYCLDCWAFFLDQYTDRIKSLPGKKIEEARESEKKWLRRAFDKEIGRKMVETELSHALSHARWMQLGHTCMKQEVKRGDKYKDAKNTKDYETAIDAYEKAAALDPADPFAKYYKAAAQLNKDSKLNLTKAYCRSLKQTFYELIPLFQDKIKQCRVQISKIQLANRHQDQSLTAGTLYFAEQKQHEMEVYHQFIASMQNVLGNDITPSIFDHPDWGEEGAMVVFQTVKKMFPLKEFRVSPRYLPRLKALLEKETSYHTYQSIIEKKIKSLRSQRPVTVTKDNFKGVFPDKDHFWNQLIAHHLLTVSELDGSSARAGYWNPTVDTNDIEFDAWGCIDADSFDWIGKLSNQQRMEIIDNLKRIGVLNQKGKLIEFNLSRPFHLPEQYTPYYKHIKDTLWSHSIYQFVLDHLAQDCVIIEKAHDIEDSSDGGMASAKSVMDILISMNPVANFPSISDIQHIQVAANGKADPLKTSEVTNKKTHVPNEVFNQKFRHLLHEHNLQATNVSGEGLDCMINAMIQHARRDYHTQCFQEDVEVIRTHLQQKHPEVPSMHVDDHCAEAVLKLVNDHCRSKIKTVSRVIASGDGPIFYDTHDERFSAGQHVVIWQQNIHHVSIVRRNDINQLPKLTHHQLNALKQWDIIKKCEGDNYAICAGLHAIQSALQENKDGLLSNPDKEQVRAFVHLKLDVDFKTLNGSPRHLLTNQHHALYDDLCQYAVIKPIKIKKDANDISRKIFGCKYFDVDVLNEYLIMKKINGLSIVERKVLVSHLLKRKIIRPSSTSTDLSTYCVCNRDDTLSSLSATFLDEAQQRGVQDYLKVMVQCKNNVDTIISTLQSKQSIIQGLDTPEITLRKLSDVFDDGMQEKGDVLGWFADNQCDLIINLTEKKWSLKTILTAIGAIALGVAQIALGAVLLVASAGTGTFFCNALIGEGVSDMIFGIEGLAKGHCNWSQYWDNKKMSLAITVATAGFGSVFAWGRRASKYAYKAFGNPSQQLMRQTAKETGQSTRKIIAKQVAREVVEKGIGATVDAGINLAVDAIVDQLETAISSMSDSLIECFDTMSNDVELNQKMSQYLRCESKENAERYLHKITTEILQRRTFLHLWDDIEEAAKSGTTVLTQAHGNATSHLQMCGEKLRGKQFMKGIGYVSRFAPLVTELLKGGMIKIKMDQVKVKLIHDLERRIEQCAKSRDEQQLLDDDVKIKEIIVKEIAAMKCHFSQEMRERGKKIVSTGLKIVTQEMKKRSFEFCKKHVIELKGHIDVGHFNNLERQLKEARKDNQIQKCKMKMKQLMARTRSPEVFARMIKDHDALLGPAFALPALEKLVDLPIRIETEDGKQILNVQRHQVEGKPPIVVKFIPGPPGHYKYDGKAFTAQQDGNNCLIHAVLAGAGKTDMCDSTVRDYIARACLEPTYPGHQYIKQGIARNYVQIGVVGGSLSYSKESKKFIGKAAWRKHMKVFTENEWHGNPQNAARSQKKLTKSTKLNDVHLNRCHRLSEISIHEMVQSAIDTKNVENVKLLRKHLLPSISEVERGESLFQDPTAKRAFLNTYSAGSGLDQAYKQQLDEVDRIISLWDTGGLEGSHYKELVRHLSNSPVNVSIGHAPTNKEVSSAMDYNPGSPRSEGIRRIFCTTPGFNEPKITECGNFSTSYFSGQETVEET